MAVQKSLSPKVGKREQKVLEERRQRAATIWPILRRRYPDAQCSLMHKTPLQLLVATILSAQCTDERVNKVTPGLFRKYRDAASLAAAPEGELERDIASTGFFRSKARSLRSMAADLVEKHAGQVPQTMQELVDLCGVGRKTANVVLGNAFHQNVGVVVDTHVARLSQRLGLTKHTDAVKIEEDLMAILPQEQWTLWPHLMIFHGRAICQARKPRCRQCPLLAYCPSGELFIKTGKAADADD